MNDRSRSDELERDLLWLQEVDTCPPRPDGPAVSRLRSAVHAAVLEHQTLKGLLAPEPPARLAGRIKRAVRRELAGRSRNARRWLLTRGAVGLAAAACLALLFTVPRSRPTDPSDWPEWLDSSSESDVLALSLAELDDDLQAVEAGVAWPSMADDFDGSLEDLSGEVDRVGAELPALPGFRTG